MTTQERGATRNSGMGGAARMQGKAVPVSCAESAAPVVASLELAGSRAHRSQLGGDHGQLGGDHSTGLELLLARGICVWGQREQPGT